jgi:hypothetical protein
MATSPSLRRSPIPRTQRSQGVDSDGMRQQAEKGQESNYCQSAINLGGVLWFFLSDQSSVWLHRASPKKTLINLRRLELNGLKNQRSICAFGKNLMRWHMPDALPSGKWRLAQFDSTGHTRPIVDCLHG